MGDVGRRNLSADSPVQYLGPRLQRLRRVSLSLVIGMEDETDCGIAMPIAGHFPIQRKRNLCETHRGLLSFKHGGGNFPLY